jgi:hypothetical protein
MANGKDSAEVVKFLTLYSSRKDWCDDDPDAIFQLAIADRFEPPTPRLRLLLPPGTLPRRCRLKTFSWRPARGWQMKGPFGVTAYHVVEGWRQSCREQQGGCDRRVLG